MTFTPKTDPQIELAVVNTATDEIERVIYEKKSGIGVGSYTYGEKMFVDEKGGMYLLCTGAYGMNPKYKTGILRIKKGEKEFDPTYSWVLNDQMIEGESGKTVWMIEGKYFGNGKLYATMDIPTYWENLTAPNWFKNKSLISFEDVTRAACAAQCHEFIESLPNGYQTLVGEGGTYLSGGETQRIALARAILKDAPIILLDEATAFADPENEGKILEAFSHLIKGKTVLVIAHRLGTVTNADCILYVDKGEIVEEGTHEELLAIHGSYAHMWETYNRAKEWTIGRKARLQ